MINIKTLTLLCAPLMLFAEFEFKGHLDLGMQSYLTSADGKHKDNFTAKQLFELKHEYDDIRTYVKLYAQEDYYDTLKEEDHTKRTFARLDEIYLKYDFEDDSIQIGKSIKFWGSLEVRNLVNVFNPTDFRVDMFNKDYLGVYNATYSHFTDDGEISAIIKVGEVDQKMAAKPYAYYFLPTFLNYDEKVQTQADRNRPSIYLKYSSSLDSDYALDYAFIYENGYDSQRYFTTNIPFSADINQNAYLVNKFMSFNTLVIGTTLIKLEALYADVIDNEKVSDYSHIGLGVEHTIENIYKSASLGLIAEYYRYDTYESGKLDDLDLFETMQNDLFLGARYSFNNADDSSFIGGAVIDSEYDESSYFLKYKSRFADTFLVECDYQQIVPSKTVATPFSMIGKHKRAGLNIAYYF